MTAHSNDLKPGDITTVRYANEDDEPDVVRVRVVAVEWRAGESGSFDVEALEGCPGTGIEAGDVWTIFDGEIDRDLLTVDTPDPDDGSDGVDIGRLHSGW